LDAGRTPGFFLDFPRYFLDICRLECLFLGQVTKQQEAVTDRVYAPRYAAAGLEDGFERVF
jgi:hypothetical protein